MESLLGYDADMKKERWYDGEGLKCPECGGALAHVTEKRDNKGTTYRTRVCRLNRAHKWATIEWVVSAGSLRRVAAAYEHDK